MQVSANPAERAEILTARLDIDLPADVRHAALLSGVQVATGAESFAILGHASADTEQEANFVELTTQYLNKDWSLNPAWLNDPKLGEFRDPLAAAVALTLGSPEFPSSKQNPAQAAKWLNEIANPTLRQQIERRLTK